MTIMETMRYDVPQQRLLTVEEFNRAWTLGVYGPEE